MPLPSSIQWKLFRSKEHFEELLAQAQEYVNSNPVSLVREPGDNPDEFIGTFRPRDPLPGRFSLIMGDCIQNLRSCLDYLVWELVLTAKAVPDWRNMFPICSTPEHFEQQLKKGRLDGVEKEAIAQVRELQPYHEGSNFHKTILWVLDNLSNTNKHRRVLLTELTCGPSDLELEVVDGQTFGGFTKMEKNAKIGPFPMVDGPRGRGPKIDVDLKVAAYIAVNDGSVKDMEITQLLSEMIRYVEERVVLRFEGFFQ